MEQVFAFIDQVRQQLVYDELRNPAEDRRTEFAFGRLHGILLACETLQDELKTYAEADAQRQETFERNF